MLSMKLKDTKQHLFLFAWVNKKDVNQHLTKQCLQTTQHCLKKNICNLPSEGIQYNELYDFPIGHYIPPE